MMRSLPSHDPALSLHRSHGRLLRWDEQRGFGFIGDTESGCDFFVHISAFPRGRQAPRLGEPLSFAIDVDGTGRKRAIDVRRPGDRNPVARPVRAEASRPSSWRGGLRAAASLVVLAALASQAWQWWSRDGTDGAAQVDMPLATTVPLLTQPATPAWQCGGRTHCSQMGSCQEAVWVQRNCPGTQMDGDADGIPCEEQFCRNGSR